MHLTDPEVIMLEEELILHAAPTLAGLKAASLFSTAAPPAHLHRAAAELAPVALLPLRRSSGRTLVYVYRPAMLRKALAPAPVQQFLRRCGYAPACAAGLLMQLRARMDLSSSFPHEIGIFLGYPLADVEGFIRCGGRDALLSGCWKVYAHPEAAASLFRQYHACRRLYAALHAQGVPLDRLIARGPQASGLHRPPDWNRSPL